MTKEQSISFMNILAELLRFINEFKFPFQTIHAMADFEAVGQRVYREMKESMEQSAAPDAFLKTLQANCKELTAEEDQERILKAYHICKWMDQVLTYEDTEDVLTGKLSIYRLIPLRTFSYVEIGALNDNYRETGIWINPKLPIFRSARPLDNGEEEERPAASRDAFTGMNGELRNISYFVWNKNCVVHNILIPYEYEENEAGDKADGTLKIGFIPVSDRADLIIPEYRIVKEGRYELNKMFIDSPGYAEEINARLQKGLELACTNNVDIVFAPEMLGNEQTEQRTGNYNLYVRQIYSKAVMNGEKPPLVTVMPSYWNEETNSAAIIYRDGYIFGRQKKYTPYIDFRSCSMEGIKQEKRREIYLIHIYGVHRIAVSICAEFIDSFDSDLICGQLGATLIIVPSYSHGERDFMNQLGTLFPYGTGVIWGDCCGAVAHSPKIIGGCSIVGHNEVHRMGSYCQCAYSCGASTGCLFTVELPLKIVMSKEAGVSQVPIQHILTEVQG